MPHCERPSAASKDAETIERARDRARGGRESIVCRRSRSSGPRRSSRRERRARRSGRAAAEDDRGGARICAVALARRGELAARQARRKAKPGQRAEADKAHAERPQGRWPRQAGGQPAAGTSYTVAAADDLPCHEHGPPPCVCALGHRPVQPVDGPGGRQSSVGPSLRPGDRAVGQRLRPQRPAAVAPGPARLAGGRVHGTRLEHEGDPPPDRHERDLPPGFRSRTRRISPATRTIIFLWRWTPRRAEAEVVRDCLFAVAGNLDSTMGGPVDRPSVRLDRAAAQPLLPARRRKADGVPADLRCGGSDRVLPPQGEHPAAASPGAGQQRSVAAPGPPAGADSVEQGRAPIPRAS